MSDFLLRDWHVTAIPGRSDVKGFLRDDSTLLAFELRGETHMVAAIDADGKELGRAEIRERESDGAAILVPVSQDPDVIAAAVAFWPRRPSIHLAALALSARVPWPTKEKP